MVPFSPHLTLEFFPTRAVRHSLRMSSSSATKDFPPLVGAVNSKLLPSAPASTAAACQGKSWVTLVDAYLSMTVVGMSQSSSLKRRGLFMRRPGRKAILWLRFRVHRYDGQEIRGCYIASSLGHRICICDNLKFVSETSIQLNSLSRAAIALEPCLASSPVLTSPTVQALVAASAVQLLLQRRSSAPSTATSFAR